MQRKKKLILIVNIIIILLLLSKLHRRTVVHILNISHDTLIYILYGITSTPTIYCFQFCWGDFDLSKLLSNANNYTYVPLYSTYSKFMNGSWTIVNNVYSTMPCLSLIHAWPLNRFQCNLVRDFHWCTS